MSDRQYNMFGVPGVQEEGVKAEYGLTPKGRLQAQDAGYASTALELFCLHVLNSIVSHGGHI